MSELENERRNMSAQVVKQDVFMCASVECWRHELLLHHHHCQSNCYHLSLSLEINYYVSVRTDVANFVSNVMSGAFQFVVKCSSLLLDSITMYHMNSQTTVINRSSPRDVFADVN